MYKIFDTYTLGADPSRKTSETSTGRPFFARPIKEKPQNLYKSTIFCPTRREKPVKPLRVGRFLPDPSRKSRKIYTGLLGKRMAGRRLEGIRKQKADKGVLEGLSHQ